MIHLIIDTVYAIFNSRWSYDVLKIVSKLILHLKLISQFTRLKLEIALYQVALAVALWFSKTLAVNIISRKFNISYLYTKMQVL